MAFASEFQEKQNLESYSLVWLDAAVYSSKENVQAQEKLRNSINYLTTFDNKNQCEKYIDSASKDDQIILIVSGQLGQMVVPQIHQLQQIIAIYIYCMNIKQHEKWAREIKKVKAVIKDLDELIKKILADQTQRQHNKTNEAISICIYSTDAAHEGESTSGINGHFIHSQLLIDCLVRLEPNMIDKNQLILLLKENYDKNAEQLKVVEEFKSQYESSAALWWYSRNCFLYHVLNKALRDQDIDLFFLFRFVIRDIERQLEEHKCTSSVRVYRGQLMSQHEIETLRNNVTQYISNNSFLSTSLNQKTALNFLLKADNPNNLERVFWTIDAESTL